MNPSKAPCLNCPDRTLTCHDTCEKYRLWKSDLNEVKRRAKAEQAIYDYFGEKHRKTK